ncbi:MAG: hypothetical protein ABSA65_15350 [Acidimicrobiales bacterium]
MSFARIRFASVTRLSQKRPALVFQHMCVKDEKPEPPELDEPGLVGVQLRSASSRCSSPATKSSAQRRMIMSRCACSLLQRRAHRSRT